eukprot:scaffold57369_cov36-Phaeocystis_antarctica.AAC.1
MGGARPAPHTRRAKRAHWARLTLTLTLTLTLALALALALTLTLTLTLTRLTGPGAAPPGA